MANLEIGDTVRLKSGGPRMTVMSFTGATGKSALCAWFVGDENKQNVFSIDALELWEEAKSDPSSSSSGSGGSGGSGIWMR